MNAAWNLRVLKVTSWVLLGTLLAFGGCVVFWPWREAPPADGICSDCGNAVLKYSYGYGSCGSFPGDRRKVLPDGQTFIVDGEPGKERVRGGCVVTWNSPGSVCPGCGRTWFQERRPWPHMLLQAWTRTVFDMED